ncbi:glyoxylate/hydroxypyruvate reductase A [Pseudomonas sp. S 311-6]|uniref:2-hydroxyacid dehydrogenase n=1 Tax=Kerstersia gyiorum TaxID=206506 RepID=A0A171KN77_9BURK|nr:glyoxylate/hydroxypyruvate reductase A [Kerstersia gyiorum]KAB0544774.1 glyoxylate/hydroxypyruvate reductase A [Kerstersia gyiorum]KKO70344.1 2-hydroxyacid dehydrogenase [Kerstersia gyiorum]MCO7641829.1 glyoxylate/hydroxypyruvate reductase A [Pseudomonas sp. S 311-6]RZS73263.1 glyoxylate/hydroxypyruvate reductase A [Kerstersia gyiorum]
MTERTQASSNAAQGADTLTAALLSRSFDLSFLKPQLEAAIPGLEVVEWPDPRHAQAELAVCWDVPDEVYAGMPRLKLVHSIAAGVDNVVAGQDLRGLPVCRVVDPDLAEGMLQYVLWSVLYFHRSLDRALAQQRQAQWLRPLQTHASTCRVGIMGLGEMGGHVAQGLVQRGYAVRGWSRTPRQLEGVQAYSGAAQFDEFLAGCDILVCLLPLTDSTRGILNRRLFAALPPGAALIHCGRGAHLVEQDLVDALASGHMRGAVLDVFAREPLPEDHPFWHMPGVVVTPHMATMASWEAVISQVADNVARLRAGQDLLNTVDPVLGY